MFTKFLCAVAFAALSVSAASADDLPSVVLKTDKSKVTLVFDRALPNVPGKSMKGVLVEYQPGGANPAHTHPASAFIYATVLEGAIRSQVNDVVLAGTSAWRVMLRRSGLSPVDRDRFSAIGALVGRLIDIASGLANAPACDLPVEQAQAKFIANAVAEVREALLARREPRLPKLEVVSGRPPATSDR